MKVVIVYHLESGSLLTLRELKKKFKKNKITIQQSIELGPQLKQQLAPYLKQANIITVVGGDGTISAVANVVTGTKAALAPLPGGTLNHFTKDLLVPQNIDEAIGRLPELKKQKIDIAKVNNIFFINNSSIGLYPYSLRLREEYETTLGKWPAAAAGTFHALIRYKTYEVTVNKSTITTPFIFIGNNSYELNGFGATNRSSLSNHTLSVYIAKSHTRWGLAIIFLHALTGRLHDTPLFDSLQTKEITIRTLGRSNVAVSHDGEVSKVATPLHYTVLPGSLYVLA